MIVRGPVRAGPDRSAEDRTVPPVEEPVLADTADTIEPPTGGRSIAALVRRGSAAGGAMVAPFAQALSSLALQVIAVRELGADGFGVYALLYSGIVMAMALSNGLVGDSLTVLDRSRPTLRGGVTVVGWISTAATGLLGLLGAGISGIVSWPLAALFALGLMAFLVENLLRRVLMAVLQFWKVVAIDLTVLVGTLGWIGGAAIVRTGSLGMGDVLGALLAGQIAGIVSGTALLPAAERWLGDRKRSRPEIGDIVRFGSWRAAQQAVRPSSLFGIRIVVIAAVGATVFGELEAARVYTAPAMLLSNGAATFYLAAFSSGRGQSRRQLLRRADIGAIALGVALLAVGAAAVGLIPIGDRLVAGGEFDLSAVAVGGWVAYAWACAVMMPYASLNSVHGRHALMVGMRVIEAAASTVAVAVLVALDVDVSWVPLAMTAGPLILIPIARWQVIHRAIIEP